MLVCCGVISENTGMIKTLLRKKIVYAFLSLFCTLLIFAYLLTHTSPGEVLQAIRNVDTRFLLAFILLSLAGSFFRALRYQLTLLPAGYSPSLLLLFLITLVRNLFSDLLPARIGTAVYVYLANTRLGIPLQLAASSFALSFIFDVLALGPLLIAVILLSQAQLPFSELSISLAALTLFIVSSLILTSLPKFLRIAKRIAAAAPLITFTTRKKLIGFAEQVSSELVLARHSGIYFPLFLLSIFVRTCKYGSLYFFLLGILAPLGITYEDANPLTSTIGILSAELAASLPISGIAGFGAYEGAWTATFSLLGFSPDVASLTAIAHHLFTQAYGYGLGALALLVLLLPLPNDEDVSLHLFKGRLYYVFRQTMVFALTCVLVFLCLQLPSQADEIQFNEKTLSDNQQADRLKALRQLPGDILFDSNRSGSFGLYILERQTGRTKTLIDSPQHEMYPTASPDGKHIVYARMLSLARFAPASVWMVNRDGTDNKKIIAAGNFPSFSTDGQTVYYELNRKKVMAFNLASGETREIFPRKKKLFRGKAIVKPRISPDGTHVAFTADIPSRWHAWIAPLGKGKPVKIGAGCEPTWYPDGTSLSWVKRHGSKAGSGLMNFSQPKNHSTILIDDGPPLGHEYFPTIDKSGKFALYSACPHDQHDHNTATYQLHALSLDATRTKTQLTFNSANNRWPSLLPDTSPPR